MEELCLQEETRRKLCLIENQYYLYQYCPENYIVMFLQRLGSLQGGAVPPVEGRLGSLQGVLYPLAKEQPVLGIPPQAGKPARGGGGAIPRRDRNNLCSMFPPCFLLVSLYVPSRWTPEGVCRGTVSTNCSPGAHIYTMPVWNPQGGLPGNSQCWLFPGGL